MSAFDKLKAAVIWVQSHKAPLGAFFLSLATIVGGAGVEYRNDDLIHVAGIIALLGTALSGGGMMKSDGFYKDRIEVLKTGLDRRNPDSIVPIPVRDLKKLLDKTSPDPPTEPDSPNG